VYGPGGPESKAPICSDLSAINILRGRRSSGKVRISGTPANRLSARVSRGAFGDRRFAGISRPRLLSHPQEVTQKLPTCRALGAFASCVRYALADSKKLLICRDNCSRINAATYQNRRRFEPIRLVSGTSGDECLGTLGGLLGGQAARYRRCSSDLFFDPVLGGRAGEYVDDPVHRPDAAGRAESGKTR
jgi:hypothetical protein